MTKFKLLWEQEREKSRKLELALKNARSIRELDAVKRELEELREHCKELFAFISEAGRELEYWRWVAIKEGVGEKRLSKLFGDAAPPPS